MRQEVQEETQEMHAPLGEEEMRKNVNGRVLGEIRLLHRRLLLQALRRPTHVRPRLPARHGRLLLRGKNLQCRHVRAWAADLR
jgi:hypothetical protein